MAEMILPDARQWIGAFEAGREARMTNERNKAVQTAGRLMTGGDFAGAAAAVAPYDMRAGLSLQQYGAEQDARKRQADYGAKIAAGDPTGAINDAYAGGDFQIAGEMADAIDKADQRQLAQAHRTATRVAEIVAPLGDIQDIGQRKAYIQQHKQELTQAGYTPEQIDSFDPTDANLATIYTQAIGLKDYLEQKKPHVVGRALVTPKGQVLYRDPELRAVGEGQTLVETGGVGGETAGAPTATGDQPRGLRNNNPLNLEATVNWDGMTGSDGRYAVFSTPEQGWAAADRNLQTYATKYGLNTISGVINRWSPPSENDTAGYIANVSQSLGVAPDAPLNLADPSVRRSLLEAMASVENGQSVGFGRGGAPSAAGSGQPTGARVVARGAPKPKWVDLSPQESAQYGPGRFQRNDGTGEIRQISGTAPKGSGSFKLSPQDSKYLSEARTAAQQLQNVVPLVERFGQLNREVGTGGILAVPGMTTAASALDPRIAEMRSITDKLTPAMRQGMPGAASDRDVAMFQSATVNLSKPGPANASVRKAIVAGAKRQGDYVAFLEAYARENGSLLGAQEEWDAYAAANPMFDRGESGQLVVRKTTPWREFFGMTQPASRAPAPATRAAPRVGEVQQGYRFNGGDPAKPGSWTKVQ